MPDETSKKVAERYIEKEAAFELEAMANYGSKYTGIEGAVVWVFVGEHEGKKIPHWPRIKVYKGDLAKGPSASVSIENNPSVKAGTLAPELRKPVFDWVKLNKVALLQYWREEIDAGDLLSQMRKV